MERKDTNHRWQQISRVAGLTIVFAVLVLVFISTLSGLDFDSFIISILLGIAAWLLGVPSIAWLIGRRNGPGQ